MVLDCTTWPTDDVGRALFGDAEVVEVGKALRMEVCNDYKYKLFKTLKIEMFVSNPQGILV